MNLSQIIKRILTDWEIDFDFTDEDIKAIERDLQNVSAIEKKMINKAVREYQRARIREAFGRRPTLNFEINLN